MTDTSRPAASPTGSAGRYSATEPGSLVGREVELARLDELLVSVRDGGSASLLVRGEPGMGKSALLDRLIASAADLHVVQAVGVEGEIDLPYAGLHQLCRSMTDGIAALPRPQADALSVAFGLSSGDAPDRYLVGLAVLSLMSEVAASRPVLCVVDDAQWVDPATTRALAFVARRLGADAVGLLIATREIVGELEHVPELELRGLADVDARALLDSVLVGRLDGPVREQFLAEANGNPLALIELPRALTPVEAATGTLRRSGNPLSSRIEESFTRRLDPLPPDTRRLLVLAAADPLGDPLLLLRAAQHLGVDLDAADAAEDAGLIEARERWSFRHPLVRSAVYRSATQRERRLAHGALADATDPEADPDRRAWHRAQATSAPDEDVALALVSTAARAKSRGGLAAAGAFLERAAMLTPDAEKRAERALEAAEVMYEAGALDAVESLLRAVDRNQLDEYQSARAERLHAELSVARGEGQRDAVLRLLASARRLEDVDSSLARATHLEALGVAFFSGDAGILEAVSVALAEASGSESGATEELLVRGWARLMEHGFPAGTDLLREAMITLTVKPELDERDLQALRYCEAVAKSSWDFDNWDILTRRSVQLARDSGAMLMLPHWLGSWAEVQTAAGEFRDAASALAEAAALAEATGRAPEWDASWLEAWRCDTTEALAGIDREEQRVPRTTSTFDSARALAYNAAGRYESALEAAQRACDLHPLGFFGLTLPDLIEAAVRCGDHERAVAAFEALVERTRLASTEWSLGLEARSAALLASNPAVAEPHYGEAVEHLGRARTRPDLARAQLLYGEWLRREGRRVDAREQLRAAHELFSGMGAPAFADRARRELAATGETARKRTDDTRADLTAQETQIARLASDGLTNSEIGAQLYLSPRTIEWHLRRVYPKLGITRRRELRSVLGA